VSGNDSQEVILGHPKPSVSARVATRTCWEHVPNKALLDLEGELKLSKATVPGGSVASLWLKLFFSNM